ncbi:hypothetical protein KDA23_02060 [Candidatus Saccharibacteria bacterium]|nr:hypothetical protein [Candidatus Saccharibacteria bacterium]
MVGSVGEELNKRLWKLVSNMQEDRAVRWIDIEDQLPPLNERVICLVPFGMQVHDDTWTEHGWLNDYGYVSHWVPICAPGTYVEIMQRERGKNDPILPGTCGHVVERELFKSEALASHFRMMQELLLTQYKLRMEAKKAVDAPSDSV